MIALGRPQHYRRATIKASDTYESWCGLLHPLFSTSDAKEVDCLNCLRSMRAYGVKR